MYGRFSVYMRAVFKGVDMNDVLVMWLSKEIDKNKSNKSPNEESPSLKIKWPLLKAHAKHYQ